MKLFGVLLGVAFALGRGRWWVWWVFASRVFPLGGVRSVGVGVGLAS